MSTQQFLFPRITEFLNRNPRLVRIAYSLLLTVCIAYCALHIYRLASLVTDENIYQDSANGVTIVSVDAGGASDRAGIRVGDIIVAVNGQTVRNTHEAMKYIVTGRAGKVLRYSIHRGGRQFDADVVLADFGLPLRLLIVLISGVLFLVLGSVVMLRRPTYPDARLFGWTFLVSGLYFPLATSYPSWYFPDIIHRLQQPLTLTAYCIGFTLLYLFSQRFPVRRFANLWPRWMYLLTAALPVGIAVFLYVVLPMKVVRPWYAFALTLMAIALLELLFRWKLRSIRNPDYPPKARYTRIAGVLSLTVLVMMHLVGDSSWQAALVPLIAIPILLFYTVIRFRLFDLYIIIRRTSMYLGLRVLLAAGLLAIFVVAMLLITRDSVSLPVVRVSGTTVEVVPLRSFAPVERSVVEKRILVSVAALITLLLWYLHRAGKRMLVARFHRGAYDYRRALQDFSQLSVQFSNVDLLAGAVVSELHAIMYLRGAAFAVRSNGCLRVAARNNLEMTPGFERAISAPDPWLPVLAAASRSVAVDNQDFRELFQHSGISLLTPVVLEGRVEAVLFIGEKRSETNFTKEDLELLDSLSINIGDALRTMRFYEGAREQERMHRELEIARRIQLSALPADIPHFPGFDIAADSIPAYEVGGDFYDVLSRHDSVTFLVGDVSGKGTSAALYLARIQGILRTIESYQPSLWELFVRANTQIFNHLERHVYLTLAGLRVDLLSNRVECVRAGHLPMLHYRAGTGAVIEHRPDGVGVGLDQRLFAQHLEVDSFATEPGDVLVMLSDGVTEACNRDHEQFGIERVTDILAATGNSCSAAIRDAIQDAVRDHCDGVAMMDDITLLVLKTEQARPA